MLLNHETLRLFSFFSQIQQIWVRLYKSYLSVVNINHKFVCNLSLMILPLIYKNSTAMLFVLKKIANKSIVVTRNYRKFNNQCFVLMSDAKDFDKNVKVEEKLSQAQPQQSLQSNFDKFDFKKWIKKEWVKTVGFTTLIGIIIGLYQIKLQYDSLKEQIQGLKDKQGFQKEKETKRQEFQQKMMEKYGQIQVYSNYIDSPVQKQVRELLNYNDQNRVKVIVGCPGIGKTTAIKKVLSDMKKDGAEVFYFSFGDSTKDQMTEKEQFYGLMIGIIKKFGKQPKYAPKKVKVVLDDINRLEKKSTFDQIMQNIYRRFNFKQIDINCISSSGSFIENQMQGQLWKSLAGKLGSMNIIQHLEDPQKIREFQIKILRNKYGERIEQLIKDGKQQNSLLIEAIVDVGLITRELELFTKLFLDSIKIEQKITIQEAKRLLKSYQQEQIKTRAGEVDRLMVEIKDKDQKVRFLYIFLSSEEQLYFSKCRKMIRDLDPKTGIRFQKVFPELEKKNMVIFCRPRARYQEKIFRTLMGKYKKSSQPTVK